MSTDHYMACGSCKECIHVAQDGFSGWTFYSGEPDCMHVLGEFLRDHSLCGQVVMAAEYHVEDFARREWRIADKATGSLSDES